MLNCVTASIVVHRRCYTRCYIDGPVERSYSNAYGLSATLLAADLARYSQVFVVGLSAVSIP